MPRLTQRPQGRRLSQATLDLRQFAQALFTGGRARLLEGFPRLPLALVSTGGVTSIRMLLGVDMVEELCFRRLHLRLELYTVGQS